MSEDLFLFDEIEKAVGLNHLKKIEIDAEISENLVFDFFDWQRAALQRFLAFDDEDQEMKPDPKAAMHLLFNLATGSGKTLLMAALMLYYYKKGYRHFIFITNQKNIISKTEENIFNDNHPKYLFQPNIVIDNRSVKISKVTMFTDSTDDLQIMFTSVQKLHNSIYTVRENSIYLEDLQKRNLVLLADEAHHLNVDTKKSGQLHLNLPSQLSESSSQEDVERSWENTVINKILHKDGQAGSNKNALLEFTATMPPGRAVQEKYRDKLIFRFELRDFINAGYTKDINLVSSSMDKRRRVIQALVFNWYRHKIALKNNIANFKPVILFRSKTIVESKADFEWFLDLVSNLTSQDFNFIIGSGNEDNTANSEIYEKGKSRIVDIKSFILENSIDWKEVVYYLKSNFSKNECIITNSESGTKTLEKLTVQQENLLNSLEDRTNKVRAIFTVQRLTEGWDVLNLFDIVRLYHGQNEGGSNKKTSIATTSEVQLIGRGIRYYPFRYPDQPTYKRKFDRQVKHELRVLEEFYYHSDDEHRYLSELKKELRSKGYIDDDKKLIRIGFKDDFKSSETYRKGIVFGNTRVPNPHRQRRSLDELKNDYSPTEVIPGIFTEEIQVDMNAHHDVVKYSSIQADPVVISLQLKDFDRHIVFKAINIQASRSHSIFRFENLKNELQVNSVDDLLDDHFLGNHLINLRIESGKKEFTDLTNAEQLQVLLHYFSKMERLLREYSNPYTSTPFKPRYFREVFIEFNDTISEENQEDKKLSTHLLQKSWFCQGGFVGTSEEKDFLNFFEGQVSRLQAMYSNILLLRNPQQLTLYDSKGRGFQPDFLLIMEDNSRPFEYQIFIEPKGDQFKDSTNNFATSKEGWKEDFLLWITKEYRDGIKQNFETKNYRLIGLPFYNKKNEGKFATSFQRELGLGG